MSIDWSKPVVDSAGNEFIPLLVGGEPLREYSGHVIGAQKDYSGDWVCDALDPQSLSNPPEPTQMWVTVDRDGVGIYWTKEEYARRAMDNGETLLRLHNTTGKWEVEVVE